ncbi:MAG: pacearchaeosortase [Candidatus Woesearchaeota archaeon]
MRYRNRLLFRYIAAIAIMAIGTPIIYFLLSPLTFYLSYFSIFYFSPTLIDSTSFLISNIKLNFINACTAASAYLLLILLTLTIDLKPKKTIKILLTGSLIILIANIIRIDILIIALVKYGSNLFNTVHLIFWKVLSTVFVVILWIFLTKLFKIKEIPIYSDFKKVYGFHRASRKNKL